jgi:hexosaminidase
MTSGQLEANSELPGQPIEYRINGGAWQAYHGPVRVSGKVELRTRSFDNRRTSRVVELGGV